MFLTIVGLRGLMRMAYAMGGQQSDAVEEPGDLFEGLGRGGTARTNITVICKQLGPRGAAPTHDCVAIQAAAPSG